MFFDGYRGRFGVYIVEIGEGRKLLGDVGVKVGMEVLLSLTRSTFALTHRKQFCSAGILEVFEGR